MLTVGSLFSGIGGLDLGLERAGMRVLWQCESDPYCRAVLRKHWPEVPCYEDVHSLPGGVGRGEGSGELGRVGTAGLGEVQPVDVLAGGFPCQPVSLAGARRGAADIRWLWPEFARLIRVLRPRFALMENVPGLLVGGGMAEVLGDLADSGYDAEWACVPAAAVGAPHLRYRVFIVAHPHGRGQQERAEFDRNAPQDAADRDSRRPHADGLRDDVADATEHGRQPWRARDAAQESERREPHRGGQQGHVAHANLFQALRPSVARRQRHPWRTEPDVGRVAHGIPSRVDRLRALGNAVVPQVAEYVGRQIMTAHLAVLDRTAEVSA